MNAWIVFLWQVVPSYVGTTHEGLLMPGVIGVYDNEALAVAACTTIDHYVYPMTMNQTLPDEPFEHPSSYYPLSPERTAEAHACSTK